MVTRVCHTCCSKVTSGSLAFDDKYDLLMSVLVTFLYVIEFISSKSFLRYQQYHNLSFDVSLVSFLFFFLFSLLIVICEKKKEKKKKKHMKHVEALVTIQRRERRIERKTKAFQAHRNSIYDITSTVTKILMRQIQQYK